MANRPAYMDMNPAERIALADRAAALNAKNMAKKQPPVSATPTAPTVAPTTSSAGNSAYLSLLQQAYQNTLANNQAQYNNAMAAAQAARDSSAKRIETAAGDALRAAYINRMRAQRDMPQQLSAMGMNGGLRETTAARLQNNYADNRAAIETGRQEQLAALDDSMLQARYAAASRLAERNAADAASYFQQLAASGQSAASATSYNYKTDPAYIAQLSNIYNGTVSYDTLRMNYQTLAAQHGVDGANELLNAALNM